MPQQPLHTRSFQMRISYSHDNAKTVKSAKTGRGKLLQEDSVVVDESDTEGTGNRLAEYDMLKSSKPDAVHTVVKVGLQRCVARGAGLEAMAAEEVRTPEIVTEDGYSEDESQGTSGSPIVVDDEEDVEDRVMVYRELQLLNHLWEAVLTHWIELPRPRDDQFQEVSASLFNFEEHFLEAASKMEEEAKLPDSSVKSLVGEWAALEEEYLSLLDSMALPLFISEEPISELKLRILKRQRKQIVKFTRGLRDLAVHQGITKDIVELLKHQERSGRNDYCD
ncbi:hypothetical protein BU23DRAFT_605082 [Bimuria novae-zelandiae CBS 107.79]|uniref:Uncharacterized protein n=1 Tax=Bimuria novae-zelandiae CBS 107.79 TaxID=1447943 RepID=A0A6A5UG17_9PLEO|nr:hypothetical protein BU23DRAFT_605082 [Bimuria novae-zelandiae CBS 107.79]